MSKTNIKEFFDLYHKYRYEDQIEFYSNRRLEFEKAHNQALWLNICLLGLTTLASGLSVINSFPSWLKLACLLAAAICPVLSTTIAAYNTLYGFEQQEKLYHDTLKNLISANSEIAPTPDLGLDDEEFEKQLQQYVQKVEGIFSTERGQWGQLALSMKPSD